MPDNRIHQVGSKGKRKSTLSRRRLLQAGGSAIVAAGAAPSVIVPGRATAQPKTLKILQWKHFVPSHDPWFDEYVKEWGEENDTQVIVDHVAVADINSLAATEVRAQRGHDLVLFITPPAAYEDEVIDHHEIYQESERRHGEVADFVARSAYNPKTRKYFGFCQAYMPALITYRKELWDAVQSAPDS